FHNFFSDPTVNFHYDLSLHDALPILPVGHDLHFVQATVVERAAVEGGDIGAAAGRHIAGLVDLAVVVPAAFAAHVSEEHVFIFRLVKNTQLNASDVANADFGDSINRK